MTWPKKHTRTVHIEGSEYLWHLSHNTIYRENRITAGTKSGKYFLFIDPYDHDFEITPSNIVRAIQWAIQNGWSPTEGPSRNMSFSNSTFRWLPDDVKFESQLLD